MGWVVERDVLVLKGDVMGFGKGGTDGRFVCGADVRVWGVVDCGQDDHGGGSGSRWQDQLRGVYEDGGEHGCVDEYDVG